MQKVLVYNEIEYTTLDFLVNINVTEVTSISELYKTLRKLTKYNHLLVFSNSHTIWEQCKLEFPFLDIILIYEKASLSAFELLKKGIDYPLKFLEDYQDLAKKLEMYLALFELCTPELQSDLTKKEKELLEFMAYNKGKVMSRELILESVWGYSEFVKSRTVEVHLAKLKQKSKNNLNLRTVNTPKGKGYMLDLSK